MDKVKQQVVETIKGHGNILVTVSTDPSVDELSAALGLTVMLNALDKRATCVFSGAIPPAINFLEPDKTFENSADSLRDFIIALDKEKADHLRYKVEGEAVKIFITPYKTQLSQADLEFSQGDYNVELVIALGVTDQGHLDRALEAHGKILHDATVLTVTVGDQGSNLGSIDWHSEKASSLSEVIAGLADDIKADQPLLDSQISSALLTGIVSATDRFSNDHTSAGVMTIAAKLMAAGANQQLIAAKLEEAHNIAPSSPVKNDSKVADSSDSSTELSIERPEKEASQVKETTPSSDSMASNPQAELEKHLADMTGSSVGASGTMADIEKQLQSATPPPPSPPATPPTPVVTPPPPTAEEQQQKPVQAMPPVQEQVVTPPPVESAQVANSTLPTASKDAGMPGFEITGEVAQSNPPVAPAPSVSTTTPPPPPVVEGQKPEPVPVASLQQQSVPLVPPLPPPPVQQVATFEQKQTSPRIIQRHDAIKMPPAVPPAINGVQSGSGEDAPINPFDDPRPSNMAEESATEATSEDVPKVDVSQSTSDISSTPQATPGVAPVLPPLPPMPPNASSMPLPPPPPPPPVGVAEENTAPPMPSGPVSGDIFGDNKATTAQQLAQSAPAEPGQFRIPGQA